MAYIREPYGKGSALDEVLSELIYLQQRYDSLLKQEFIRGEVKCLASWIESYAQGCTDSAYLLAEYGPILLENIHSKLKAAASDLQRFDAESPAIVNTNGRKAHHLVKASQIAIKAQKQLQYALKTNPSFNPIST